MGLRSIFSVAIAAALVAVATMPSSVHAASPSLRSRVVQSGLQNPWDVAFTPGGQMLVTERPGRVKVFKSGGAGAPLLATTHLLRVHAAGEAGVMGIAVDPYFTSNRYVYVCVSRDKDGQWLNQVIRYRVGADWKLSQVRAVIRTGMKASTIHNGCAVEIGPDRKLWVSMGDANQPALAQNPTALNGKILRLNRNGGVPGDNPIMPGTTVRTIVYSMGHRNPQGIAFHPVSGRVYAIEHGPDRSDEINWIRTASGNAGRNYGWPCVTGYSTTYSWISGCSSASFTNPAWHSGSSTIATSGGAFVRGSKWGSFAKNLFVAQLKQQDLRRFAIRNSGATVVYRRTFFNERWGRLRGVTLGPGKKLWITTSNGSNDKVIRVAPIL